MMISKLVLRALAIFVGSAALAFAQTAQPLQLEKTIELPDVQGRIDHMSIDVKGRATVRLSAGEQHSRSHRCQGRQTRQYDPWLAAASGSSVCTRSGPVIRRQR